MRVIVASMITLGAVACAPPRPVPPTPPLVDTRIPFRLSSMQSNYLVRAEASGAVTVLTDSVIIEVTRMHWLRAETGVTAPGTVIRGLTFVGGLAYSVEYSRGSAIGRPVPPCVESKGTKATGEPCPSGFIPGEHAWSLDATTERHSLRDSVAAGDSGAAGPFRFAIQRAPGSPLSWEWVAFRFEYSVPPRPPGVVMLQASSLCTRRDVFLPPYVDTLGTTSKGTDYAKWC